MRDLKPPTTRRKREIIDEMTNIRSVIQRLEDRYERRVAEYHGLDYKKFRRMMRRP